MTLPSLTDPHRGTTQSHWSITWHYPVSLIHNVTLPSFTDPYRDATQFHWSLNLRWKLKEHVPVKSESWRNTYLSSAGPKTEDGTRYPGFSESATKLRVKNNEQGLFMTSSANSLRHWVGILDVLRCAVSCCCQMTFPHGDNKVVLYGR